MVDFRIMVAGFVFLVVGVVFGPESVECAVGLLAGDEVPLFGDVNSCDRFVCGADGVKCPVWGLAGPEAASLVRVHTLNWYGDWYSSLCGGVSTVVWRARICQVPTSDRQYRYTILGIPVACGR